jgi:hypothetical protein
MKGSPTSDSTGLAIISALIYDAARSPVNRGVGLRL